MLAVAGFALGAATVWLAKPEHVEAAIPPSKSERSREARRNDAGKDRSREARRWMDRIEAEKVGDVAKDVPTGDLRSVIEGVMESVWGGMNRQQQEALFTLISEWARRDPKAALAWAHSLRQPTQREVGLISIAAAIAEKDPRAGFEVYSELPEVRTSLGTAVLEKMFNSLYQEAAGKGPAGVLEFARRIPKNETNMIMGIRMDYPEGFDFATLADGLSKITSDSRTRLPFEPTSVLGAWALRDPDAAFDHVIAQSANGQRQDIVSLASSISEKSGSLEGEEWMGGKLASLGPEEQFNLIKQSDLLNSPGILRRYIAAFPGDEAAAEFQFQVIRASSDGTYGPGLEVLNDIPEVGDRVAMISRLRGIKDATALRSAMKGWNVPSERIEQVVAEVLRPVDGN